MTYGDEKTLTFRTSPEFLHQYRDLDVAYDAAFAKERALARSGDADGAAQASAEQARLLQKQLDLTLDEIERHWAAHVIEPDPKVPDFPDDWRVQFCGRIVRVSYQEREAYKND